MAVVISQDKEKVVDTLIKCYVVDIEACGVVSRYQVTADQYEMDSEEIVFYRSGEEVACFMVNRLIGYYDYNWCEVV